MEQLAQEPQEMWKSMQYDKKIEGSEADCFSMSWLFYGFLERESR